ncbi:MAG: metallophosphoesterase [Synergistaceae bacterium]|nr:metallophosphoesterase [Synergistaceae bacterium]
MILLCIFGMVSYVGYKMWKGFGAKLVIIWLALFVIFLVNFPLRLFSLMTFGILVMAAYVCCKTWKGSGAKLAVIWTVISVVTVFGRLIIVRTFGITGAPVPPVLSVFAYLYFPFVGFSFTLFLLADLIKFPLWLFLKMKFNAKRELLIVFGLTIAMLCYGYYEAGNIRTVEISIPTSKLPAGVDAIRIVQITDLHIGKNSNPNHIYRAMEITKAVNPDLVVMTGDIVDMDMRGDEYYFKILGDVEAPLGKFAVIGNHEYYVGLTQSIEFMERAGYTVLRSDWRDIGQMIIAGADDPGHVTDVEQNDSLKLLSSIPEDLRDKFILFLRHQPNARENIRGLFDLKLSGHTHGGQVWPIKYVVRSIYGIEQGLSVFGDSFLYISNGVGVWGPPIRFLTPPEVTVFNVMRR